MGTTTQQNDSRLRPGAPNSALISFVGAIGTLMFVAVVYFASGLYYGMERETFAKARSGTSPLLEATVTDVRKRLESWNMRLDEETATEHVTSPIQRAMQLVQSELQSAQGN